MTLIHSLRYKKKYFLLSWNFNYWNRRSQSIEIVVVKVWRLGGLGKIARATLKEKKKQFIIDSNYPAILNSRKFINNYLFIIAKLLKSLEPAKSNQKSLGGHDKAY